MRFTLIIFLLSAINAFGQKNDDKTFETFAHKQDSLCRVAYKNRDTNEYKKVLKGLLAKYDKQPADTKAENKDYIRGAYYNLCCIYSLMNKKSMALLYLKKAMDEGYYEYAHMQEDSDLNNIRHEKEFVALMKPLKNSYDYMYVIKNAARYNNADNRDVPAFTYQSASDPNLTALRKGFKLDSIAGTGTIQSRMINILHWIHNMIPHDGSHPNPVIRNAMSMIAECKRDKRGLNCRGLSTVLNECYLAMGFKSRFVTCLPKDSLGIDDDCHVIVTAYDTTQKKWLWMDPTFDAYVMNEKGEILSIEEVRERIIDGRPMIINPDANWNHINSLDKDDYLYRYMAKNLYRIECDVHSQYNNETKEEGKTISFIELLPLEYYKQTPDKSENKDQKTNTTYVSYNTNNEEKFWAAPK